MWYEPQETSSGLQIILKWRGPLRKSHAWGVVWRHTQSNSSRFPIVCSFLSSLWHTVWLPPSSLSHVLYQSPKWVSFPWQWASMREESALWLDMVPIHMEVLDNHVHMQQETQAHQYGVLLLAVNLVFYFVPATLCLGYCWINNIYRTWVWSLQWKTTCQCKWM